MSSQDSLRRSGGGARIRRALRPRLAQGGVEAVLGSGEH